MRVLLLFFCSGATALVYEVLWSKYLSMLLGSTVQAQTLVLAVFMGGLALGNRIFGKRADLLTKPLTAYGWIEVVIGLYAFFFYAIYGLGDALFVGVGKNLLEHSTLLLMVKGLISAGLLIVPTVLMGGTLPLLAAWLQGRADSGEKFFERNPIGIFYAVNSLGAVFGAGIAGFYLVQNLGLPMSLQAAAFVNVIVGIAAVAIGKQTEPFEAKARGTVTGSAGSVRVGWMGGLVMLTGAISMGLEVLFARSLALLVGGSLQAFAIVLMSFILGIGLGSLVISSSALAQRKPARVIFGLLLGAGSLVALYVILIEEWTILYSNLRFGLAANRSGYIGHQFLVALVAMIVLGLPASLLGAVLPLCLRLVSGEGGLVANKVGRLLTANTLGAVVGVLVTGFLLMPMLGLRNALAGLAMLVVAIAVGTALKQNFRRSRNVGLTIGLVLLGAILLTGEDWRYVVGSGIFRLRNSALTKESIETRKKNVELLFYKDAPDATVAVERSTNQGQRQIFLRINGKVDASTVGDLATQYLLAHLPMAARPDAKEVFVLGFGSGITGGAFLGHPIERLTIAENCQPVLDAAPLFAQWNRGVKTNSRTRIRREDARTVLKLSEQKYDVIISEPSNPWVAGIGSVFSREFYELAASRLSEGGVMAQWFHIYEMHDGIVFLVLRTFAEAFPYVEIWDSQGGDIILLGSRKPWESNPAAYQKLFEREGPRGDLNAVGIKAGVSLWARQIASQRTAFAIPGSGATQSDEFPVLEYLAPEAFFIGQTSEELFTFDERTYQYLLAPPEKVQVLKALPGGLLWETFREYPSCNQELAKYIALRGSGAAPNAAAAGFDRLLPIVFRTPDTYGDPTSLTERVIADYGELLLAESSFLREPEQWEKSVRKIQEKLSGLDPKEAKGLPYKPEYYAAVAARNAAGRGQYALAKDLVLLGVQFKPEDLQLKYLASLISMRAPEFRQEFASLISASGNSN